MAAAPPPRMSMDTPGSTRSVAATGAAPDRRTVSLGSVPMPGPSGSVQPPLRTDGRESRRHRDRHRDRRRDRDRNRDRDRSRRHKDGKRGDSHEQEKRRNDSKRGRGTLTDSSSVAGPLDARTVVRGQRYAAEEEARSHAEPGRAQRLVAFPNLATSARSRFPESLGSVLTLPRACGRHIAPPAPGRGHVEAAAQRRSCRRDPTTAVSRR